MKNGPVLAAILALVWLSSLATTAVAAERTILVLGDSISAAYGMPSERGWVHLLRARLDKEKYGHDVVNASLSGETTDGGLARLPALLEKHRPAVVVLELGGNDGLRGFPLDLIEQNLDAMVTMAQSAGARVLMVGMVLPPNYGPRYTSGFEALFRNVAARRGVPLLPFLLDGVATSADMLQTDRIHPEPAAQPIILDGVWPLLIPLLDP